MASFADDFTSVTVLAMPAVPGDVTAAEGLVYSAAEILPITAYLFSGLSVLCGRQFSWYSTVLRRHCVCEVSACELVFTCCCVCSAVFPR